MATPEECQNEVCKDCMKWEKFGSSCHAFWENKKVCSLKVRTPEEWQMQNVSAH